MNLFALSSLLNFITFITIAIFVFLRGKDRKVALAFTIFSLVGAIWGLGGYGFSTTHSKEIAFFWWRIANIGAILAPVTYAHFIFVFFDKSKKTIVIISYLLALIYLILNCFTEKLFIGNLQFLFDQFYYIDWTKYKSPIYLLFYLYSYWLLLLYILTLMIREYKSISGFKKQQLKYLIVAAVIGWIGPHFDFLLAFGVTFYPFANLLLSLYIAIMAYAILRHKLLDIEVIIKKTLIFAGLFTIVYGVFAFFALLGQVFFERFITQNRWVSMIPSVFVVTVMLRPLQNFLVTATDKYLFQKKYDYKELLKTFTSDVLTVLDLDKLIKLTEDKLTLIMKLNYCKVIITGNANIKTEAVLKLPISMNRQNIGVLLLGDKKSDEEYTQDDMDVLNSLAKALAIAISNAMLFDELTKVQAEAAKKDKMATVGTLAAGMAHEIRNPITTIRVFSEYAPDRINDNEFRDKYRGVVTKEVDKIDHIIQTLVDFSGEEAMEESEGVSAHESVEELISLISQNKDISGRVQFINEISPDLAKINANREELDEIILNLTQNAIHAISNKGTIRFSAVEEAGNVSIEISDTGSGMSEETIKHIFDPFFTTRTKGYGLGLFVVKELVTRNNGTISVESGIGEGSTFRLKFRALRN